MITAFDPVFDENSKILILGSMPSVKSLEQGFYYGHPQNRFWKILGEIVGEKFPDDIPGKKEMLFKHGIALFDVIAACEREGSLDSAIRNALPADLSVFPNLGQMKVFTNGKLAEKLLKKYYPDLPFAPLPSTSPANQAHFDRGKWLELKKYL